MVRSVSWAAARFAVSRGGATVGNFGNIDVVIPAYAYIDDDDGRMLEVCIDGAMNEWLRTCLPEQFTGVHFFNDADDTTHADVLKVLDCAIAKAEAPV